MSGVLRHVKMSEVDEVTISKPTMRRAHLKTVEKTNSWKSMHLRSETGPY